MTSSILVCVNTFFVIAVSSFFIVLIGALFLCLVAAHSRKYYISKLADKNVILLLMTFFIFLYVIIVIFDVFLYVLAGKGTSAEETCNELARYLAFLRICYLLVLNSVILLIFPGLNAFIGEKIVGITNRTQAALLLIAGLINCFQAKGVTLHDEIGDFCLPVNYSPVEWSVLTLETVFLCTLGGIVYKLRKKLRPEGTESAKNELDVFFDGFLWLIFAWPLLQYCGVAYIRSYWGAVGAYASSAYIDLDTTEIDLQWSLLMFGLSSLYVPISFVSLIVMSRFLAEKRIYVREMTKRKKKKKKHKKRKKGKKMKRVTFFIPGQLQGIDEVVEEEGEEMEEMEEEEVDEDAMYLEKMEEDNV